MQHNIKCENYNYNVQLNMSKHIQSQLSQEPNVKNAKILDIIVLTTKSTPMLYHINI
jgi:hypothetical protein